MNLMCSLSSDQVLESSDICLYYRSSAMAAQNKSYEQDAILIKHDKGKDGSNLLEIKDIKNM